MAPLREVPLPKTEAEYKAGLATLDRSTLLKLCRRGGISAHRLKSNPELVHLLWLKFGSLSASATGGWTAGPWRVVEDRTLPTGTGRHLAVCIVGPERQTGDVVLSPLVATCEWETDARLIAAAPELVAMLSRMLAHAEELNRRLPAPTTREDRDAGYGCNPYTVLAFKDARALLARIGGAA